MMNDPISQAKAEVEKVLNGLKPRVFKDGTELTFIMRMPGNEACEMVVTNDDLAEVEKVIKRMRERERT